MSRVWCMGMPNVLFGLCLLTLAALSTLSGANPSATKASHSNAPSNNLFTWTRPDSPRSRLPITQSATCRFKRSLGVAFTNLGAELATAGKQIHYQIGDEDESDTVSFVDLDTKTPKVQSNGGQASLNVVYDDGQRLTLLNNQQAGAEMYTIFRDSGVVVYTQQKESLLIGPFGMIAMGYCY